MYHHISVLLMLNYNVWKQNNFAWELDLISIRAHGNPSVPFTNRLITMSLKTNAYYNVSNKPNQSLWVPCTEYIIQTRLYCNTHFVLCQYHKPYNNATNLIIRKPPCMHITGICDTFIESLYLPRVHGPL